MHTITSRSELVNQRLRVSRVNGVLGFYIETTTKPHLFVVLDPAPERVEPEDHEDTGVKFSRRLALRELPAQ